MHSHQVVRLILAGLFSFSPFALAGTPVTWNRQAFGQQMTNPCGTMFNWPDNNNWSQGEVIDIACALNYVAQPSNWSTPTVPNGAAVDVILTAPTAPTNINVGLTLNSLTVQSGAGNFTMQSGSFLDVQNYDFQADGTVLNIGGGGASPFIRVAGTMKKSAGNGTLDLTGGANDIYFRYAGGTIQVDTGTLKLGRSLDESTGANFIVAAGAVLEFNSQPNGASGNYSGPYTGTGSGAFQVNGNYINIVASGATFNFSGDLFQWSGGTLGAGPGLTNLGTINLVGPGAKQIDGQTFHNAGLMTQNGTGNLQFGINSLMFNDASGTYDIRSDAGVNPGGRIDNLGVFKKSAGTGVSSIGNPPGGETVFNHLGGTVEVMTGTLRLARGDSTGGTFIVAPGATLDLNSGSVSGSYSGMYTGTGGGTIQMNTGNININNQGATFDFENFEWHGGTISAGPVFNQAGTMTLLGSGGWGINGTGFTNTGTMIHAGTGALQWGANALMTNAAGGVYDIRTDGLITNFGRINNSGTFRKSAGAGVATIGTPQAECAFRLLGGTVEVTSGTLRLGRSYPESTGATFIVGAGAVLDLTGASGAACEYNGTYTGTGAGRLELNGGQISILSPGGTFNFAGDLFQWSGGSIFHASPDPFNNDGTITIAGDVAVHGFGMTNNGTIKGAGILRFTGSPTFLQNNGMIAPGNAGAPGRLDLVFGNGDLTLESTSVLSFQIGGTDQGTSYSWLNKTDNRPLVLGGSLKIELLNGFVPQDSDVFEILTTQAALSGQFSNVPNGSRLVTADGGGSFKVHYGVLNDAQLSTTLMLSDFEPTTAHLANIATRGRVLTGDSAMIGGFIINGTQPKQIIARGIGPSLTQFGVADALGNPTLQLFSGGTELASNDDWRTNEAQVLPTGLAPSHDLESAIVQTLAPGAYTVILRGQNDGVGVALVEVYEVGASINSVLANIATRGFVGTGDNVLIGGVIAGPTGVPGTNVVIRAIGPSLSGFGVAGALADPVLELYDGNGMLQDSNDDWQMHPNAGQVQMANLAPTDTHEGAIYTTINPGGTTAIVRGKDGGTGVALVEVYNVAPPAPGTVAPASAATGSAPAR